MLTINPKEVSIPVLHSFLQGAIAPRPERKEAVKRKTAVKVFFILKYSLKLRNIGLNICYSTIRIFVDIRQ